MNTALKHWREAATVILAAGLRRAQSADSLKTGLEKVTRIAHKSAFDYQVLLLKRSGNSGFMPNAYVFPGGLVDASDFSSEWQEVFKSFTKVPYYGIGVAKQPPETRPPIFATDRAQLGSPIPGDVAFRICAVRETFEESGVLLAVPKHEESGIRVRTDDARDSDPQPTLTTLSRLWDRDVLSKWRSLVISDSANFIKMCKEIQTKFQPFCKYIQMVLNSWEIHCLVSQWSSPSEVLHSYKSKEIWIAPPQFYELGRMRRFPALRDLHHFAWQRSLDGCEQWLPILLVAPDCFASILPGDGLYPEKVDPSGRSGGVMKTEKSLEELQRDSANLHRIVSQDPYSITVQMNITPKYNHLSPLCGIDVDNPSKDHSEL
ncbi:nucleoside diphosphate-linked moiety X motif 19-like [Sinocyclocheilus rhinocerous]|uniref:Acyl-coenzyme A diphosphatase NUDT19 n=1 Tax=Sinocyclocheilus rhinocerous TaxID=307959 RepID=A0A673GZQ5_9TELE|nr:PREDICTED: nucleoside diphosphate-linked moiety X motif 19-like [Sinocyclocheilus rhinocerous]